jgi:pre-rRNA-processing protein TSR4
VRQAFSSVRCFRNQLPRKNPYYPLESRDTPLRPDEFVKLCVICGCKADFKCSKCQMVNYCSKAHQKSHWNVHKKVCGKCAEQSSRHNCEQSSASLGEVFPVYGLSVSEEECNETIDTGKNEAIPDGVHVWDGAGGSPTRSFY